MAEDTQPVELGTIRLAKADAELLKSVKDSGTHEHDTYARIVRLYVRMGLTLHRNGIMTVEQLESALKAVSEPDLTQLENRIVDRVLVAMGKPKLKPAKKERKKA